MESKQTVHAIKGLRQDIGKSKQSAEYAIELKNVRLTAREESTMLSITNEKGTSFLLDIGLEETESIVGKVVFDNIVIIFTNTSEAYLINVETKKSKKIISNNDKENTPTVNYVEALVNIETEHLIKVYWIDGINQPKVMVLRKELNENNEYDYTVTNPYSLGFNSNLELKENLIIEQQYKGGKFSPGVIQYAFNYYNNNGQESNIVEVSPLYYITHDKRGASPEDTVNNSFKITIENPDTNFDYLRLYSIHRSALDDVPYVKLIKDIQLDKIIYHKEFSDNFYNMYKDIIDNNINLNPLGRAENTYLNIVSTSPYSWNIKLNLKDYNYSNREEFEANYNNNNLLSYSINDKEKIININIITYIYDGLNYFNPNIYASVNNERFKQDLKLIGVDFSITTDEEDGIYLYDLGPKSILIEQYVELNNKYFIDNGLSGSVVDPSELLYKGGDFIIPKAITQKDGTLFFGNITINNFKLNFSEDSLEQWKKSNTLSWINRDLKGSIDLNGYYPYEHTNIPGFKSRETYRLGVQFQHKSGKWSDPIFYADSTVTASPRSIIKNEGSLAIHSNPIAQLTIPEEIKNQALNQDYIRVRPVVVFPQDDERNIIAQGIVCPTMFNAETRQNGTCFAQSSWFLRPTVNRDLLGAYNTDATLSAYTSNNLYAKTKEELDIYILGEVLNGFSDIPEDNFTSKYGSWAEFRHYYPLPHASSKNAEISTSAVGYITKKEDSSSPWHYNNYAVTRSDRKDHKAYLDILSDEFSDSFFIDQSIITLHSPEIELGKVVDVSNYKARIVGAVPFDSNAGDIHIEISNSGYRVGTTNFHNDLFTGVINPNYIYPNEDGEVKNIGNGARSLIAGNFFFDSGHDSLVEGGNVGDGRSHIIGHAVYPWQAKTTLNARIRYEDRDKYAVLKRKQLSNLKYSAGTVYFNDDDCTSFDSDVYLFSESPVFMEVPENLKVDDSNTKWKYNGNINMLITPKTYLEGEKDMWIAIGNEEVATDYETIITPAIHSYYIKLESYEKESDISSKEKDFMKELKITSFTSYKTYVAEAASGDSSKKRKLLDSGLLNNVTIWPEYYYYWVGRNKYASSYGKGESFNEKKLFNGPFIAGQYNAENNYGVYTKEPIEIKYKSSPHAVLALHYKKSEEKDYNIQQILPTGDVKSDGVTPINIKRLLPELNNCTYGNMLLKEIKPLNTKKYNFRNSFLWLVELYQDDLENKFNGDDYLSNVWYPAGKAVRLEDSNEIQFTHGDTFYARFDTLKTYPYDTSAFNDTNSIVEIGSFMVETRVNLDTRYDRNRGNQSNLVMNPNNFNFFNDVYNQKDVFFNYRMIDEDITDNTKFYSTIVWSKQKFSGSDTDPWTSINMISSLDLDATNGSISKLENFNNEIFAFQDRSISHILFNSRVQIPTSDNNPIEITNSYKVDGFRQSSPLGSSNPLHIKTTEGGIYFINDEDRGVYVFNGEASMNVSDKYGLGVWFKNQDLDTFRIDYDKLNKDVYFTGKDNCVNFAAKLDQFESFFDYNDSIIFNVKNRTYAFKNNKLYELFAGEYNYFFDDYKDFHVTITHNDNPFNDKVYNNLEFRADTYKWNTTAEKFELSNISAFNTIEVENEYQSGEDILDFLKYSTSNMKRKFRIWRAHIPRDSYNKQDRIRNTWTNITLKAKNPKNTKTELHDLIVNYFV